MPEPLLFRLGREVFVLAEEVAKPLCSFRYGTPRSLNLSGRIPEHIELKIGWRAMISLLEIGAALFHSFSCDSQRVPGIFPIRLVGCKSRPDVRQYLITG